MTGAEGVRAELREAARDAVVRSHHELFRAAQRAVGVEPVAYDHLSERTKRLKHNQLDPQADAAVDAILAIVGPVLARAEQREARVRELHQPINTITGGGTDQMCAECRNQPITQHDIGWPCPTIAALDQGESE